MGVTYFMRQLGLCNLKLTEIWILCFVAFKYWGSEDVDINEELSGIANRAALGEEGINGNLSHQFSVSMSLHLDLIWAFWTEQGFSELRILT